MEACSRHDLTRSGACTECWPLLFSEPIKLDLTGIDPDLIVMRPGQRWVVGRESVSFIESKNVPKCIKPGHAPDCECATL